MTDTLLRASKIARALYGRAQRAVQDRPLVDLSVVKIIIGSLPNDDDGGAKP